LARLAQTRRHERVILAQEGPEDQHPILLTELRNRHAQPWHTGHSLLESRVDAAQAEIHILGSKGAYEPRQQGELFSRGVMVSDSTDLFGAKLIAHGIEAVHDHLQGVAP